MTLNRLLIVLALAGLAPGSARAQGEILAPPEDRPVRAAHYPALSPDGKTLCFSYLGDLWTVSSSGGVASRLTVHEAHDAYPRWSPDGRWIAFSSNRDSSFYDIYLVPSVGGESRQITFHSGSDIVNDWSPDGSKILFYSGRGNRPGFEEHEIDVRTGVVKTLTRLQSTLRYASYSPDGSSIAFTKMPGPIQYWRPRYHGSANAEIFVQSLKDGKTTRVTDHDGMDLWPMFAPDGRTLYYASDVANGTPNIVRVPLGGGKPSPVTRHTGDAVRFPSIARDGSLIAYEYDGKLWTVRPGSNPRELDIIARTEARSNLYQRLTLASGATEAEVSPDGKQLALALRGEIWTLPTDRLPSGQATAGDATRLTNNPAHDFDFNWSTDNARIAFVSDRHGPYQIYSIDVKTRAEKRLTEGAYNDTSPIFSPDGKLLSFLRSGPQGGIYVMPAEGGAARRVAASEGNNLFGVGITSYSWSPDSKWLAFSRRDTLDVRDVWLVQVGATEPGEAVNVTRYPGNNEGPRWTADGKYLLFASDRSGSASLYWLPLEKPKDEEGEKPAMPAGTAPAEKKPVEVKIDFDEIHLRAQAVSMQGEPASFEPSPDGKGVVVAMVQGGAADYWLLNLPGGSTTRLTTGGQAGAAPRFVADGSKFYYLAAGGAIRSLPKSGGSPATVAYSARLELDRRAEIAQAFNEFWRNLNTGFYDPGMHGIDWRAVRARYEPLLPHVATKEDFATLLSYMVGELNASHTEISPASGPPGLTTGLLGIELDESHPGPGVKVAKVLPNGPTDRDPNKLLPGEYILSIDGVDVQLNEALWKPLQDKAARTVELLVNSKPEKEGARTIKVKPATLAALANLDYERQVKEARKKVEELSGGRLAYLHIRSMDNTSFARFERELFGDAQRKEGLVLDIRGNGGGNTHDRLLNPLSRAVYGYTQPRDAARTTQPVRHWNKPIILLIDETSASDAEIFPYGFRALKLGKIVGEPTPGYVIGTYSGSLADGTGYRIPMWGWFTQDGRNMENNGVQPDVRVENDPTKVAAGRDPQLETAVKLLLEDVGKRK